MISFVCGQLCSGKTLYATTLSQISDCVFIEVGDIVRAIKKTVDRKKLQDSKALYKNIVTRLKALVEAHEPKQLVVSGVRQKEILEAFPDATVLWIECPKKERKSRYAKRAREGDNQSFEEAERGDIDLGILDVKKYILEQKIP
jgi:dephospho-CoA kinase